MVQSACLKVTESHNLQHFFSLQYINMSSQTDAYIFVAILLFVIAAIPIWIMGYNVRKYGKGNVYEYQSSYIFGAAVTLILLGCGVTSAVLASNSTKPEETKSGNAPHIAPNLL